LHTGALSTWLLRYPDKALARSGQLQLNFPSITANLFGQGSQHCETPVEVTNRLEVSRTRRCELAGLEPLIDCTLGIAGGGQMMRQEFRLALDEIGETLL
jgi:hypothetical protein